MKQSYTYTKPLFFLAVLTTIISSCEKSGPDEAITRPVIESISPSSGTYNTVVTLTGKDFGASANEGEVTFDGTKGVIEEWSQTTIKVKAPQHAPGKVNVKVKVADKESNMKEFTYVQGLQGTQAFVAPKGTVLHYRVTGSSETVNVYQTVLDVKDVADRPGERAVTIQSEIDGALPKEGRADISNEQTTYYIAIGKNYEQLFMGQPGIRNFSVTGGPVKLMLPHQWGNGLVALIQGGPIVISFETGQGNTAEQVKITTSFYDAKILGIETVTVSAGTFECYKYSYTQKVKTEGGISDETINNFTAWIAPGVGEIKSTTISSKGNNSSSELVSIKN